MTELGASSEAIACAVDAVKARDLREAERRSKRAAQKADQRARKRLSLDNASPLLRRSADEAETLPLDKKGPPDPLKETQPLTPPKASPSPVCDARANDFPADALSSFWETYPHQVGRRPAEKAFHRVQADGQVSFATLMAGLDRYVRTKPPDREWCNPATWLNQGRWDDEPYETSSTKIRRDELSRRETSSGINFVTAMARGFARESAEYRDDDND